MGRINFLADKEAESMGPGQKFEPAPRGIYTLQIADHSDGEVTQGGKYPGTPITKFICEIADDGPEFGKRVWHNVTWIPRGKGEKANPGHGIAVHFLNAIRMLNEGGQFEFFEESDFQAKQFRALLEVEDYQNGQYLNKKNVIREIYSENHPEPAELPPPSVKKPASSKPAPAGQAVSDPAVDKELGW